MKYYFWSAERDERGDKYPHLNQASGIVTAESVFEAWEKAQADAKKDLGNTWAFTIKAFNEVSS